MTMSEKVIPVHQWTNGGDEVFVVRFVSKDGKSYGGFQHPVTIGESVTALDWRPDFKCGGGIHGWPLGLGIGDDKDSDWSALWQVYGVQPADITGEIEGGQKCKFRTGVLRFMGTWDAAMLFVLAEQMAWVHYSARGAASATGESGAASATGLASAAVVTGWGGKARAGKFGCIALSWWNAKENRFEMRCALVGPGRLKPDIWYSLDEKGEFVEVVE